MTDKAMTSTVAGLAMAILDFTMLESRIYVVVEKQYMHLQHFQSHSYQIENVYNVTKLTESNVLVKAIQGLCI